MIRAIVSAAVLLVASFAAGAACVPDGTRTQSVTLSVEGKRIERWNIAPGEIHRLRLPGGFELGVQVDPATPQKYRELFAKLRDLGKGGIDELVKISIFNMAGETPKELSVTWGGANSIQGFGPRGGANGIPELGDQIELWFHKPVCVTPETVANLEK